MRNYQINQGALLPLESSDSMILKSDIHLEFCRFAQCLNFNYLGGTCHRSYKLYESCLFFSEYTDRYYWADLESGTIAEISNNPDTWTYEQDQQFNDYIIERELEKERNAEINGELEYEENQIRLANYWANAL